MRLRPLPDEIKNKNGEIHYLLYFNIIFRKTGKKRVTSSPIGGERRRCYPSGDRVTHHEMPKTFRVPTTKPAIPAIVSVPQRATSPALHPVVEVFLTVKMNTPARTTTPIERYTMPPIILAMF